VDKLVRSAVVDFACVLLAIGHEEEVGLRNIQNGLRLLEARNRVDMFASSEVYDFHRLIPESRNKQAPPFHIH
jgi:hypothetical protein